LREELFPPKPNAPNKLRVITLAAVRPICLVTGLSNTFSNVDFSSFFEAFAGFSSACCADLCAASLSFAVKISQALSRSSSLAYLLKIFY
jgi:hypothetical protein